MNGLPGHCSVRLYSLLAVLAVTLNLGDVRFLAVLALTKTTLNKSPYLKLRGQVKGVERVWACDCRSE